MADIRIRIAVDPSGAESGSRRAERAVERVGAAADRATDRAGRLDNTLGRLGGALAVGGIIAALVGYTRIADEIASANAQLKLATKTQQDLNKAQQVSYAIAQKQGVAYGAIATLMAKSTKSATAMGMSMGDALKAGEGAAAAIAAGIRVSGTSAEAAKAGVFQLSQALSSGVLRGEELNSVMENIPGVADALAAAMGKPLGELRKMGAAGTLTSKAVIEGLNKARPELERLAAMIPLTFSGAFQKVKNAAGQLFVGIDQGVGFGAAIKAAMEGLAGALDFLGKNIEAVSNIMIGVLVAAAVKVAGAHIVAGTAARNQAAANLALATSAATVARAQQAQALSSLAVARAMAAQGVSTGGAGIAAAAANLAAANRAIVTTQAAAAAARTGLAGATASAGLFGGALVRAATIGRAALALIGGPIGLVITALVGVILYAGKAAASFQPIAGEAATVGDYVMEAFSQMGTYLGGVATKIWKWFGETWKGIGKMARPLLVGLIDGFLSVGRAVAGVAAGIAAAFRESFNQTGKLIAALAQDAAAVMSGNFSAVGATAKVGAAAPGAVAGAFRGGYQSGSGAFGGASGESVVKAMENLPGQIGAAIMSSDAVQGLRKGANERAAARAKAQQGGAADPGAPGSADGKGDKDKAKAKSAAEKEKTFADILAEAKEEAMLAGVVTYERDRQSAILAAQKELKRDLSATEKEQLTAAIQLKQNNEANLALSEKTLDVQQATREAKLQAAAEEARLKGNLPMAVALEAEAEVQKLLNQAKREGTVLDQAKVEAYREATQLAAIETEQIRAQAEAKRALQEIADNARKAIQSAVSDAIYAGLSGDIKGVKGLFKAIGDIMKRALAEQITASLFGKGATANQQKVTKAAVDIVTPAARALAEATNTVTSALTGKPAALEENLDGVITVIGAAKSPLEGVLGNLVRMFGGLLDGMGGIGKKIKKGVKDILPPDAMKKITDGMAYGQLGGMVPGALGMKGSSMGASLGGIAGSFIGGPLGAAIGGAIGSALLGAFKKAKTGTATINGVDGVVTGGNDAKSKKAASGAANSVMDEIKKMAKALGGGVANFGNITLGQRDGAWRVNTTGTSTKKKKGAVDFGDDQAGAIAFAVQEAIKRGAFTGLSKGVEEAIKTGKASVEEAVNFMDTSKKIKRQALALVDPIAAAVADVDDEFRVLLAQYKTFGESTVELEKVYLDQRGKAMTKALDDQLSGVRSFVAELRGGTLGGASVSDRAAEQNRLFTAIEAAQAGGQKVDYNQLNTVGRALIDATRELEGATPDFYAQVNRVMGVLEAAIAGGSNPTVQSILPAGLDFGTTVTAPIVTGLEVITTAVNDNFDKLLNAMNAQSQAIVRGNVGIQTAVEHVMIDPQVDFDRFDMRGF